MLKNNPETHIVSKTDVKLLPDDKFKQLFTYSEAKTAWSIVMQENEIIRDYLKEDPLNFVVQQPTSKEYIALNVDYLKMEFKMRNQAENLVIQDGKQQYTMYYKCLKTRTLNPTNIVSTQPYMKMFMQTFVRTPEWFEEGFPPGSRVYKLIETSERLPSIVSTAVYYQHTSFISADHCEDKYGPLGIKTYALAEILNEEEILDDEHTTAEHTTAEHTTAEHTTAELTTAEYTE